MYEQLSKELKASLFQRIKSPFFGSFLIGLFIFNYRYFFVLLSDKSLEDKFKLIDSNNLIINVEPLNIPIINFQIDSIYLTTLIYPFLFALFYIGIVPFFEYYISMPIWKKHQNRLKERYAKLENEEIFLGTEKDKYLSEILNLKKEKNKLIEELTNIDIANESKKIDKIKEELNLKHNKEKEKLNTDFNITLKDKEKFLIDNYENILEEKNKEFNDKNKELSTQYENKIKDLEKLKNSLLLSKEHEIVSKTDEIRILKNDKYFLQEAKEQLENELNKYKEKEIIKKRFQENKYKEYLGVFSQEEMTYFETIYKHNVPDSISKSIFINKMIESSGLQRNTIEYLTSVLEEKSLIKINTAGYVFYEKKLKEIIYQIFSDSNIEK